MLQQGYIGVPIILKNFIFKNDMNHIMLAFFIGSNNPNFSEMI